MAEELRIVLIGQAAFGQKVLEGLFDQGYSVAGVFVAPDVEGKPFDPVKETAVAREAPVYQFKRLRDQEAIDAFTALAPDLCVMAFVTDIVPEAILTAPRLGTIQYHPSLLPKHRGPSSINWSIIQGETQTGLTIFWPDAGLDTGPVLLQKEVEIGPDDTLGTVYFDKLFPIGVEAMLEAARMAAKGTAPRLVQDESQATYESWCRAKDAIIDWTEPIDVIYNLVRGADPSPGAGTRLKGAGVQFYNTSKLGPESDRTPGEVCEVKDDGFRVAAAGGSLFVRRVKPENAKKVSASEWAAATGLEPGMKFEN